MTWIEPGQTWALFAIITSGVAICIYLEQHYNWAAKASGPVLALLLAMALSNLKLVPASAAAYDVVDDYLVPLAIPLLLFRADLRVIWRETGSMFAAFHVATVGTILGAILASFLFRGSIERLPEMTAIMTGSYIGGGVNFVAIRNSYQVESELANPLIVADNFIMAGVFALLLVLSGMRFFLSRFPHPHTDSSTGKSSHVLAAQHWSRKEVSLLDLSKTVALGFVIAALSIQIAGWMKAEFVSPWMGALAGNSFVWMTGLTVLTTSCCRGLIGELRGADEIGAFLLYQFFFVIGLRADLWQVLLNVPVLFLFCLVIAMTNLVFTLVMSWVLRLNLEEALLSVNATLGGAPSAAAMAISKGWSKLVLPGFLAGIWGYIIGTFIGISVGELVKWLGS